VGLTQTVPNTKDKLDLKHGTNQDLSEGQIMVEKRRISWPQTNSTKKH